MTHKTLSEIGLRVGSCLSPAAASDVSILPALEQEQAASPVDQAPYTSCWTERPMRLDCRSISPLSHTRTVLAVADLVRTAPCNVSGQLNTGRFAAHFCQLRGSRRSRGRSFQSVRSISILRTLLSPSLTEAKRKLSSRLRWLT